MGEKEFIKIYEKIVDEQQDIMQKTSKIKEEVGALQTEYENCDSDRKEQITKRLNQLGDELEVLEQRSKKNQDRAKKLKSES